MRTYRKWTRESIDAFAEDWNRGMSHAELIERWGYQHPRHVAYYLRRVYGAPIKLRQTPPKEL